MALVDRDVMSSTYHRKTKRPSAIFWAAFRPAVSGSREKLNRNPLVLVAFAAIADIKKNVDISR